VGGHKYDSNREGDISLAVTEAWTWLEVQGLLVPTPGNDHGWRTLSRRAEKMKTPADTQRFAK
jgi:hypothetical protein